MVVDAVEVRFSVLGPVRAWCHGTEIDLGSPQQCGVLGLLLLGRGRPISLETLVDQMWGESAPCAARATVRTYLSRLRRALAAADDSFVIESGRGGYGLPVPLEALDLAVFEARVAEARTVRANGELTAAAWLLREALGLWRGPALAGARGEFVADERSRLDQLRLVALEERIALDLELGRHGEVLAELSGLVLSAPMQERLRELQMLALYRCSRQADALAVYRDVRGLLDDELGIEPGPELRGLHERILRGDPGLDLPSAPPLPAVSAPPAVAALARPTRPGPDALPAPPGGRGVVADRLQAVRGRGFVGRGVERELFAAALAGEPGAFVVLFLHGPGGVGKSTLARRLADDAVAASRPVMRVDGRVVGSSSAAFLDVVGAAPHTPGVVLVIDTFEQCQALEPWLREDFLPGLPEDALVIIAGRNQPSPSWRTDPSWAGALHIRSVSDLGPTEAAALLRVRGVPVELHRSVMAYAGGHPLALSLAAEVTSRVADPASVLVPDRDVIETLLTELVGTAPSPAHRFALQVCAHAHSTTEDLLRVVIPGSDASALFGWLRGLPYIECGSHGIYPHDVVRDALEMDLRWRDPAGHDEIQLRVRDYVLTHLVARRITGVQAHWIAGSLRAQGVEVPEALAARATNPAVQFGAGPADVEEMLALATEVYGVQSARITEFWLARQHSAFRVYRRHGTGEMLAFGCRLILTEPRPDELAADPGVAAAWDQAVAIGAPERGQHIAVIRGVVRPQGLDDQTADRPAPPPGARPMSQFPDPHADPLLAWSFIVSPDPEFWQPVMDYLDRTRLPVTPIIDGYPFGLFSHDNRLDRGPTVTTRTPGDQDSPATSPRRGRR